MPLLAVHSSACCGIKYAYTLAYIRKKCNKKAKICILSPFIPKHQYKKGAFLINIPTISCPKHKNGGNIPAFTEFLFAKTEYFLYNNQNTNHRKRREVCFV